MIGIFSTYLAFPNEDEKDIFAMPKRAEIEELAIELLKRLYGDENVPDVEVFEDDEEEEEDTEVKTASTFAQSLQEKIKAKRGPKIKEGQSIEKTLKSEMKLFEATNGQQRGDLLQKLFVILKNIAPTSIASEQSFSIAANFITKIRSRLSDEAIDDLCFEKGYFANEGFSYA